jgi:pectate lyase
LKASPSSVVTFPARALLLSASVGLLLACAGSDSGGERPPENGSGRAGATNGGSAAGGQGGAGAGGQSAGSAGRTGSGGASGGSGTGGVDAAGASAVGGRNAAGSGAGGEAGGAGGLGAGGSSAGGTEQAGSANAGKAGSGSAGSGGVEAGASGAGGAGGSGNASGTGPTDCTTPPPMSALIGWAAESGGTTGGGDQAPVVVRTAQELTQNVGGDSPRVIHIDGNISGSFSIGSNKTLIGICGAQIRGHIGIGGQSNVILFNLKVVGNNCSDSPQDCSSGADAIGINGGSDHVWVDHLDVSDGSDGNLDITQGSDFITVSWTKFSYSTRRTDPDAGASGHRFSNLIGASDTDPSDVGHLNITYHHSWWADNVDQRMPRTRRGQIHVFNNLFTAAGNSYCTNAGQDAKLLVQNNIYSGVNDPLDVSANGNMKAEGNEFPGATGTQSAMGTGFVPPYTFTLDPTASLEAAIRAGVGPK